MLHRLILGVASKCHNDTYLTDALLKGPQPYSPMQQPGKCSRNMYGSVRIGPRNEGQGLFSCLLTL